MSQRLTLQQQTRIIELVKVLHHAKMYGEKKEYNKAKERLKNLINYFHLYDIPFDSIVSMAESAIYRAEGNLKNV